MSLAQGNLALTPPAMMPNWRAHVGQSGEGRGNSKRLSASQYRGAAAAAVVHEHGQRRPRLERVHLILRGLVDTFDQQEWFGCREICILTMKHNSSPESRVTTYQPGTIVN